VKQFNPDILRRNKKLFLNYSQQRRRCAYELFPQTAAVAFEIIPALLSLNESYLPGFVPKGEMACGIYGIGSSKKLKTTINTYFIETRNKTFSYQRHLIKRPIIESLFLMGSIGTIAQNDNSDFDFWVCVDTSRTHAADMQNLHQKVDKIARWCQSKFDMEVHFFIMDIKDIRNNEFGKVNEESAGSSQKKFLKEEFYRTLLLVCGKIPFWWVIPSGLPPNVYNNLWTDWITNNSFDLYDFVDLGFLGDIPKEEFLGTTLWHLSKGIKDPFKALIKMTMMERYLSDSFQGSLLCDVIKDRVFAGSGSLRNTDPYLLMIETNLEFYLGLKRRDRAELLRKAFYIKVNPKLTRLKLISRNTNYQIEVFKELLGNWGWSLHVCEDLNQIENWSYARHLKFSTKINTFFSSIYKQLRQALPHNETQIINEHDLTLLGRKLYVLFAKNKGKLQLTPFLKKGGLILEKCIFQLRSEPADKYDWHLYDATNYPFEAPGKKSNIFKSRRVARAAAWLINNGLYDFHRTKVEMAPNPSGLNVNDLIDLLKHLQGYFLPALAQIKMGSNLQSLARRNQIMIVIDLEKDSLAWGTTRTDIIYKNTWGELYTETYTLQQALLVIKKEIHSMDPEEITRKVKIHVPKSAQSIYMKREIYQAIMPEK
jgi:adenylate cyclase, class 1